MDVRYIINRLEARAADLDAGSRRLVGLQVLTRQVAAELRDLAKLIAEEPREGQ